MLNESIPTASARAASSTVFRITTSPLNSWPDSSTLMGTNESSPNSMSCGSVISVLLHPALVRRLLRFVALLWFVARRRLDANRSHEQVVERGFLLCAECAQQLVLDQAEPRVGEAELLNAPR